MNKHPPPALALVALVAPLLPLLCGCNRTKPNGTTDNTAPASTRPTAIERAEDGFLARSPAGVVRVSAVRDGVFRVRIGKDESALPQDTGTFIAPGQPPAAGQIAKTTERITITTPGGSLTLDRADGGLSLRGKDGQVRYGVLTWAKSAEGCRLTARASEDEHVYGLGNNSRRKDESLAKTEGTSAVGNGVSQPPFLWSTAGYGVLVRCEKPGVVWRRTGRDHAWTVPEEMVDLYLFVGDTPAQMLDAYSGLTGRPLVPPRWTFGYLQSRWSYKDAADIQAKWRTFREKKIPVDAFIYDYDWYRDDWVWKAETFPDPPADVRKAKALGIRTVLIRKPRVNGENLALAEKNGWIGARRGRGIDLDFAQESVRDWWWGKHVPLVRDGVAGWWNDEAEQYYLEYYYMTLCQFEGLAQTKPGARNWSLNRAFTPGIQRLGAVVWTGDIESSWESLQKTGQTLLSYGLSGMPHAGCDIGGFVGTPSPELFVRWIQAGVFHPMMRAHGNEGENRWPWAFGPEAERAITQAIELRYRLIPYLYSLAHESYRTGAPLMRPLFWEFAGDSDLANRDDEWLLGPSVLAAPQLAAGGKREVYLPAGTWYEWPKGKVHQGPKTLSGVTSALNGTPVYIRAGGILPLGPVMQHTEERPVDPLTVEVFTGASGAFTLYEDDGLTYGYQKGQVARTPLRWDEGKRTLTLGPTAGDYPGRPRARAYIARIYGVARPASVALNGGRASWRYDAATKTVEVTLGRQSLKTPLTVRLR